MSREIESRLEKIRKKRDLSSFDLCSIDSLNLKDIELIFDLAREFKKIGNQKLDLLKNKTVFNAFFENSTRTRSSFELAGKTLGADVVNISGDSTSTKKGETMIDTCQTLDALNADAIVIRTADNGMPYIVSKHVSASIVNAGDGRHEHPSQGLLDGFTMQEHFKNLKGKNYLIIGDILHSRVFGSTARIIQKLGMNLRISAPETFIPKDIEKVFKGVKIYHDIEKALKDADVVHTLRVQTERGAQGYVPSLKEFSQAFGINKTRFELANKNAILMHPGPVIRNTELSSDMVAHPNSRILEQVNNGLAIRKAILWLTCVRMDKKKKQFTRI